MDRNNLPHFNSNNFTKGSDYVLSGFNSRFRAHEMDT